VTKNLLLGLGLLLLGGGLAFGGGRSIYRAHVSQRWPSTQATIVSSSVERIRSRRSVSFVPRVSYEYKVAGKTYTSETLAFGAAESGGGVEDANSLVHQYPKGATVQIHYAPDDASLACLDCGAVAIADYVIALGGLGVLGLVGYSLVGTFRAAQRARNRTQGKAGARAGKA
jgi:uncharacterized protein DUF3592